MSPVIDYCKSEEFASLLKLIDTEFVFSKNRLRSLAERFPAVYSPNNLANIYVARCNGVLAASVTVRKFIWHATGRIWRGAMVGMVFTCPAYRKRGIGSAMMQRIQQDLASAGMDFAVLWTKIPQFYERLGWLSNDCSAFGEALPEIDKSSGVLIKPRHLSENMYKLLDAIRHKKQIEFLERVPSDYAAIPLPAETVDLLLSEKPEGYSIVGRTHTACYLYEAPGDPDFWERLLPSLRYAYPKLYLNQQTGSPFQKWLCENASVKWEAQNLAMWLPLTKQASCIGIGKWYIPYFDRI